MTVLAVFAGVGVGYLVGAICARWNEDERVELRVQVRLDDAVRAAVRERDLMWARRNTLSPVARSLEDLASFAHPETVTN